MKFNWVLLGVFVGVSLFSAGNLEAKTPYYICDANDIGEYMALILDGTLDPDLVEAVQDPNCIPELTDVERLHDFVQNVYPVRTKGNRKFVDYSQTTFPGTPISGFFAISQTHKLDPYKRYHYIYTIQEEQQSGSLRVLHTSSWMSGLPPMAGMKAFAVFAQTWGSNP